MTDPAPNGTNDQQPNGGSNDSGWTPPASKEEFNRIIGERVARVRAQFSDYADLQSKAAQVDELNEKLAAAEAEKAHVPAEVAAQLRTHLVALHGIDKDDADLFLTATDSETLLRQVNRLVGRSKQHGLYTPREGTSPDTPVDEKRQVASALFGTDAG